MNTQSNTTERAPVIAIMGHIDHGKSTLLSYIRHSSEPLREAGGITQHVSAYEVEHTRADGTPQSITFLDTPGHEAFSGIRKRGASVADIAILVVSAEDGVKPQTLEALRAIRDSKTPFIVAINKIDKPGADLERTKQSLAENEIYIEGYGGDVPAVPISAKTGEGVPELLDMILLVAELEGLTGDRSVHGSGVVIESSRDVKKGVAATCIIKNGTIRKGMYVAAGESVAPIRLMENFLGKAITEASFSSPVRIIGWDKLPSVGDPFETYASRDEAYAHVEKFRLAEQQKGSKVTAHAESTRLPLPLIIKADAGGSLEAALYEIAKLGNERIEPQVVSSGIGTISENDVRLASGQTKAVILGFNVKVDPPAKALADRSEISIQTFDIIYKMSEWLAELLTSKTPKMATEETIGQAKILKVFSKIKDKQVLGGRVEHGEIRLGAQVKILRRENEIGQGKVRELQQQKNRSESAAEGTEFGALIEAKAEIMPGDHIVAYIVTEK